MKNKLTTIFLVGLLVLLCACGLSATGGAEEEPYKEIDGGEVGGSDLRTRRGYSYALIKEDAMEDTGEGKDLYVLYFFFDNNVLAFYENSPYMSPMLDIDLSSLEKPHYPFQNLYIADKNQDGYGDLCLPLTEEEEFFVFWEPDDWAFGYGSAPEEGPWITIANWPEDATLLDREENDKGAAHYVWGFEDGARLLLERSPAGKSGKSAIRSAVAKAEGVKSANITISKSSALTKSLTYPSYRLSYRTKSGSSRFLNKDAVVQTDEWDFRIHVTMPIENGKALREKDANVWLSSLIFQTQLQAREE